MKTMTVKPWHSALMIIVLIAIFGLLTNYLLNNETVKPIVIESNQLTKSQFGALQQAIEPIGEVQFFGADLVKIHQTISQLTWVESAHVQRDWNNGVVVSVAARRPIANFGSDRLLDANGVVYEPAESLGGRRLIIVKLHGQDTESQPIMQTLKRINVWYAPLDVQVQDLILTPRQTWIIRFNNGMRIMVDHEDAEQKLYNLAIQLQGALANDFGRIGSVDLRYKNGFAIAWRNQA